MKKDLLAGDTGRSLLTATGSLRLVLELGDDVKACVEMMSGALWVRRRSIAS